MSAKRVALTRSLRSVEVAADAERSSVEHFATLERCFDEAGLRAISSEDPSASSCYDGNVVRIEWVRDGERHVVERRNLADTSNSCRDAGAAGLWPCVEAVWPSRWPL